MKVLKAYKTELRPNKAQAGILRKTAGCARFAYNWGLARRIKEYEETKKSSSAITQHKQLNTLKDSDFPWMREVSKCAPQEALRDLDKAYAGFFRRIKSGGTPGFPKFKSRHRTTPSFRINSSTVATKTHIRIPKVGKIRLKESGYIPTNAKSKSVTVRCSGGGRWFVSVLIEEEVPEVAIRSGDACGIDLGLKPFAVTSDGGVVEAPKFLRKKERRLKRLQRRVSRRDKGGSNRRKAVDRLAVQHFRVACARKDFLHKASSMLVKTKPVIVIEDLNVSGMLKNHKLAKSISDAGWSEFVRQLKYKSERGGNTLIVADRFFASSKTCSRCGCKKSSLSLSERTFVCESCGFECDRDLNAALNLKQYGQSVLRTKENTGSFSEINACGESCVVKHLAEAGRKESA